jgi:hypothetical protein
LRVGTRAGTDTKQILEKASHTRGSAFFLCLFGTFVSNSWVRLPRQAHDESDRESTRFPLDGGRLSLRGRRRRILRAALRAPRRKTGARAHFHSNSVASTHAGFAKSVATMMGQVGIRAWGNLRHPHRTVRSDLKHRGTVFFAFAFFAAKDFHSSNSTDAEEGWRPRYVEPHLFCLDSQVGGADYLRCFACGVFVRCHHMALYNLGRPHPLAC